MKAGRGRATRSTTRPEGNRDEDVGNVVGRFIDLCTEVATEADERGEGLVLSADAWDRFREEFNDEEIEDALKIVQENCLQDELVDAADSLSASLVELFGRLGAESSFAEAVKSGVTLSLDAVDNIVRRVGRLEDILSGYRDGEPPDRSDLDTLSRRFLDRGIEPEMKPPRSDS